MKKSNTQSISKILNDFIKDSNIGPKLKEVDILNAWESLLGKAISSYTKNLIIRNGVLYATMSSPVVKSELMMMKGEIIKRLNAEVGEEVIHSIVFK